MKIQLPKLHLHRPTIIYTDNRIYSWIVDPELFFCNSILSCNPGYQDFEESENQAHAVKTKNYIALINRLLRVELWYEKNKAKKI